MHFLDFEDLYAKAERGDRAVELLREMIKDESYLAYYYDDCHRCGTYRETGEHSPTCAIVRTQALLDEVSHATT